VNFDDVVFDLPPTSDCCKTYFVKFRRSG